MNKIGYWANKKRPSMFNEKNHNWKGKDASYWAIHGWIRRKLGKPIVCSYCGKPKKCEWANKNHLYKRDINEWRSLCHHCHRLYDYMRKPINLFEPKNLLFFKLGAA